MMTCSFPCVPRCQSQAHRHIQGRVRWTRNGDNSRHSRRRGHRCSGVAVGRSRDHRSGFDLLTAVSLRDSRDNERPENETTVSQHARPPKTTRGPRTPVRCLRHRTALPLYSCPMHHEDPDNRSHRGPASRLSIPSRLVPAARLPDLSPAVTPPCSQPDTESPGGTAKTVRSRSNPSLGIPARHLSVSRSIPISHPFR